MRKEGGKKVIYIDYTASFGQEGLFIAADEFVPLTSGRTSVYPDAALGQRRVRQLPL